MQPGIFWLRSKESLWQTATLLKGWKRQNSPVAVSVIFFRWFKKKKSRKLFEKKRKASPQKAEFRWKAEDWHPCKAYCFKGRHGRGNKGTLKVVRTRLKHVLIYTKIEFVTIDTSCKLYFKSENILQLRTSNSFVDCQLPCAPLTLFGFHL